MIEWVVVVSSDVAVGSPSNLLELNLYQQLHFIRVPVENAYVNVFAVH
jgi:hypothetical protein